MINALKLQGVLPPQVSRAVEELRDELGLDTWPSALEIRGFAAEGLMLRKRGDKVELGWQKPVHFYRGLSLLKTALGLDSFETEQTPAFTTGVMFDMSRNAVLRPDTLRGLLRKMALMGMDCGMLYTEDTYEVPGEPYFGYLRGRYSLQALAALDEYAAMLGIELIPCVQTLGHLNRVLHWPSMARYADNGEVLLADEPETYKLLREMLTAAAAPFRSRRIHIGMDEAHGIGLGAHLRRFGYEKPQPIISRHLRKVKAITDALGLRPMMWSDMYFRPDSPTGGYYDAEPSPEAAAGVVPGVDLVYWDYYHNTTEEYETMIRRHKALTDEVIFTGGIWTWAGPAPDYEKTLRTSLAALEACRRQGVKEVFAAAWGDNGAEANFLTALPGMQLYAECAYDGAFSMDKLAARFEACCGAPLEPFLRLSEFNRVPGMRETSLRPVNAAKFLLYQDPLVQLFAKDTEGLPMARHYAGLAADYEAYAAEGGPYKDLMAFYASLARLLALKCGWHENIARLVLAGDREAALAEADRLESAIGEAEKLRTLWRALWQKTNKPYGFEIIDGRMGALRARLETASYRVRRWAKGDREETLPELREEPLPYTAREGGALFGSYAIGEIVSACKIDL